MFNARHFELILIICFFIFTVIRHVNVFVFISSTAALFCMKHCMIIGNFDDIRNICNEQIVCI